MVAMSDSIPNDLGADFRDQLLTAERELSQEPNAPAGALAKVRAILDRVEVATPGGVPLHAQLDTVRKWLDALDRPADHERFGGTRHLRAHVATQLRLAVGALDDYQRTRRP